MSRLEDFFPNKSFRNSLIANGGFNVNQRAWVSGTPLAAGVYGLDRWKAGAAGCTATTATTGGVTVLTITAGDLQQVVESDQMGPGQMFLSWVGTAQGGIDGGVKAASPVPYSFAGGANITIEFGAGTVSNVKLEYGDKATPFVPRPHAEELALCQRYYLNLIGISGVYKWIDRLTNGADGYLQSFPVTMRVAPTISFTGYAVNSCTLFDTQSQIDFVQVRVSTTTATNYRIYGGTITADAEL